MGRGPGQRARHSEITRFSEAEGGALSAISAFVEGRDVNCTSLMGIHGQCLQAAVLISGAEAAPPALPAVSRLPQGWLGAVGGVYRLRIVGVYGQGCR